MFFNEQNSKCILQDLRTDDLNHFFTSPYLKHLIKISFFLCVFHVYWVHKT